MEVTIKHSNVDYRYDINPVDGEFQVSSAGRTVAVIRKSENWQQVSGEALPPETLRQLLLYIEAYYD